MSVLSLWHVTHLPVLRCVVYSIIKSTGRAACRVKVPAASTVAELCTRLCTRFKLDASDAAQAHVAVTEGAVDCGAAPAPFQANPANCGCRQVEQHCRHKHC